MFNAQLTAEAKAKLKALAQVEHTYAYSLLENAFWQLWDRLPEDKRRAAEIVAQLTGETPTEEDS
ncbi:MAG: hypothetical protein SX243_07620 [Acidobacteriota bacterium]|nr:hypothetical protein [Acidobacteriota bacterium]